ncbi:FkbM family methyltransferase [Cytobacillus firmus]|uniref:FkbM family methyltransferase n=1 Tax=Cytobacillus firmus TaxID=1399 RepID=UPI00218A0BCC|nr:FkbM family methyltransferase [Cytobacillus firmus]URM33460.1 FkbM family methyltransferase [Cytobacillus firmus]
MNNNILTFDQLKSVINPYLFSILDIPQREYKIKNVHPTNLLKMNRLDVVAKYLYAKNKNSEYYKGLYISLIEKINKFVESDYSGKVGKDSFLTSFNSLISSMENNGFDSSVSVIPVDRNGNIIDGSHRLAVALYLDVEVSTVTFDISIEHNFDYLFLQEKLFQEGYTETLVHEYIKMKNDIRTAILFSNPKKSFSIGSNILGQNSKILYEKSINLTPIGQKNFIINLYEGEQWLGSIENNYKGSTQKQIGCFQYGSVIRVIFIEEDTENLLDKKSKIRSLFGIGNHSIHTSDTYDETIKLAELLLNKNSIHLLNYQKFDFIKTVNELLNDFSQLLSEMSISKENVIIDSGCVLGIYGIRKPSDIDFITGYSSTQEKITGNHNNYFRPEQIKEYLENRENYFSYKGFKFLALNEVLKMKKNRGEYKDLEDIKACNNYFENNFQHVNHYLENIYSSLFTKNVICFGSGGFFQKVYSLFKNMSYIVDNDINKQGKSINGLSIYDPKILKKIAKDEVMLIITSQYYDEISVQLKDYGFEENVNYFRGEFIWNLLINFGDQEKFLCFQGYKVSFPKGCSLIEQVRYGEYEKVLVEKIVSELSFVERPVLLDIGANIGLVSLSVKKKLPQSQIFAFEPRLETFNHLVKTLENNSLQKEITAFNLALGNTDGFADFYLHNEKDASGDGLVDTKRAGETTKTSVKILKLDSLWEQNSFPKVDVIKIDVEGAEYLVLEGAKKLLSTFSPIIIMEFFPENMKSYPFEVEDLFSLFEELEYQCTTINGKIVNHSNFDEVVEDTVILKRKGNKFF